MRLKEYLDKTRKEGERMDARCIRFAKRLNVSHHTILKWINGQRNIKDPMKLKIEKLTDGEVTLLEMMPR